MHSPLLIESVLAVIGADKILAAEPTFTHAQFRRARDLPDEIRQAFERFFASAKFDKSEPLPPFDYADVLALVSSPQDTDQTNALATAMPDADMAMELGIEANRVRTWADQSIPRNPRTTLTGTKMDPPDPESAASFRTRWQVACDPIVVVRDALEGCLDADQVSTLALLYPELYQAIRQACVDAMTAEAAKHGTEWDPTPDKAAQVRTLLQMTQFDPALASTVQKSYQAQAAKRPAPKPQKKQDVDISGLTPGQKAAAGTS
jgi:hypothetical protein